MTATPSSTTRKLIVICLASAGWSFGFGLVAPLASVWLQDARFANKIIGRNTAVYYLGIALAATFVPRLMRRWGNGCPAAGMVLSGLTIALFPWGGSLAGWFSLRFLNGVFGAMSLIPMETYVNRDLPETDRARNFGIYAFSVALGWALGTLIGLQMYAGAAAAAFVLGGAVSAVAGLLIVCAMPPPATPVEDPQGREPLPVVPNLLSWGSAWSQGFLEGGMIGLLPIYLLAIGLTNDGVSWLSSGIMIGVIVTQIPIASLADRFGRTTVLLGCYAVTIAGLASLPFCGVSAWLVVWLFLVGSCSGAFYPLGLALLGTRVPPANLGRAGAWYLAINCVGSLTGPAVTGEIMDWLGTRAMFLAGVGAVALVLVVCAAANSPFFRKTNGTNRPAHLEARDAA